MIKTVIALSGVIALAFSACTQDEKVFNHATGEYYAIERNHEDWSVLPQ